VIFYPLAWLLARLYLASARVATRLGGQLPKRWRNAWR